MIEIKRRLDWDLCLSDFLLDSVREGVCLDWEFFNCASWCCDGIEAMTGVDLYEEFRGQSKSMASAFSMIHKAGYKSFEEIIASKLPTIPVAYARRGDLVL
ncbi:hypothetical protein VJI72_07910, partial [Parvimonas micra]|uniref:DUF6950 family protein n=3 Tax=Parvimonas TaxID=543311 RepID=UPI002B496506